MKTKRHWFIKKNKTLFLQSYLPILLLFVLPACKMAYLGVDLRTTPVESKINQKLVIVLGDVKDVVVMDGMAGRKLTVTQFRASVTSALKKMFETSFAQVEFSAALPDTGLALQVYRIEPYWKITRDVDVENILLGTNWGPRDKRTEPQTTVRRSNETQYFSRAVFQLQCTLYDKGKEVSRVDQNVYSSKDMPSASLFLRKKVFTSGFIGSMEAIHELIVIIPELPQKLQEVND